ncbi:MAG: ABC transporter ATP-binding protein [Clostridium sp.]
MDITIKDLTVKFGDVTAVNNVSLEFTHGEFTTILGPSGCGKTTLLRAIAGLEDATDGEISFGNKIILSKKNKVNIPTYKRNVAMVFQDFALWPHMTVYENVAYPLRASGIKIGVKESVTESINKVKLQGFEKRYPRELSGGQQQRVAFARAIVNKPKVILFDEPLSALDLVLKEEMKYELRELVKELNVTAIYVTHDQGEAMSMSNKIVLMNGGEIQQVDKPEILYSNPKNKFACKFIGKSNWLDKNKMVRPEDIIITDKIHSCNDIVSLNGEGKGAIYLGNIFENIIKVKGIDEPWIINSKFPIKEGEKIILAINNKNIYKFN